MTDIPNEPKTEEQHSDRKWKILVVILAVLLILSGGCMIFWGGVPFFPAFAPNEPGSTSQGAGLAVDPNASEYVPPTQAPGVTIPGFGSLTVPANTKEIYGINLYNPIENEGSPIKREASTSFPPLTSAKCSCRRRILLASLSKIRP